MPSPLQPDLHPGSRRQWRLIGLLSLTALVLALGWWQQRHRAPIVALVTGPGGTSDTYRETVPRLMGEATSSIWVMMYVVRADPDDPADRPGALLRALATAAKRGLDVRVVLDVGSDWKTGEPDSKHVEAAAWLTAHGVKVVLDEEKTTTHAKIIIIDGRRAVVGSHNWTSSALSRNREASLLIEDRPVIAEIENLLLGVPGFGSAR